MKKCEAKTEVYSRIVGYFRPVQDWNDGKKAEFKIRKTFILSPGETQNKELNDGCIEKG